MKVLLLLLLLTGPLLAQDALFQQKAQAFVALYLELNPELATILGEHRHDGKLTDYSPEGLDRQRALYRGTLAELQPLEGLSPVNTVDRDILRTNAEYALFSLDKLKQHEWDPSLYNPGSALNALVARDFAPLPARLESLAQRLEATPRLLEQARRNLKNPTRIHTETAIRMNAGTISLIEKELDEFVARAPQLKQRLAPARAKAVAALKAYGEWLQKDLLPRANGDFRLGDELFREKLRFALESDLTKEEILQRAEAELARTRAEMEALAKELGHPSVKAALAALAEHRPTNRTILAKARESLARCTEFVRAKDLVRVPDEPLKIIEMPEFARGVSIAYCDSPGALEKKGETFYAISPTPQDWSAERALSFYKEYNDYMLEDLTVHEAMPGHYLQLMHANRFQAPTQLRAIFGSGTFVEGWATYAEQVMAAAGYGGAPVRMQQLKMRLRLILNAILDQKIHTAGMTEQEAMDLMMTQGFQEEGEAAGKWRRACLTSTQLSTYFVGNAEVNDIAAAYRKAHPDHTTRQMHDAMLSFGSPAPRYVKRLLLGGEGGR